jgi:hypothetical protein
VLEEKDEIVGAVWSRTTVSEKEGAINELLFPYS